MPLLPMIGAKLLLVLGSRVSSKLWRPLEKGLVVNLGQDSVDWVFKDCVDSFAGLLTSIVVVVFSSRLLGILSASFWPQH